MDADYRVVVLTVGGERFVVEGRPSAQDLVDTCVHIEAHWGPIESVHREVRPDGFACFIKEC